MLDQVITKIIISCILKEEAIVDKILCKRLYNPVMIDHSLKEDQQ
jgi:hypothetical protein